MVFPIRQPLLTLFPDLHKSNEFVSHEFLSPVISQLQPYPINSHPVQTRSRSGLQQNRLYTCLSNTF